MSQPRRRNEHPHIEDRSHGWFLVRQGQSANPAHRAVVGAGWIQARSTRGSAMHGAGNAVRPFHRIACKRFLNFAKTDAPLSESTAFTKPPSRRPKKTQ